MKINHFVNTEMFKLMELLKEAKYDYRVYTYEAACGNFGILIGDFNAIWYIDITEYLIGTVSDAERFYSTGLSILTSMNGHEEYRDVNNAEEAMEIIKNFFAKTI